MVATAPDAAALAVEAAAGKDVVVFGADLARKCLQGGLLDELVVHIAPVLLGEGVRLLARRGRGLFRCS